MRDTAADPRRAARQPTYEVHELLDGEPALDLGIRAVSWDFLDAVHDALEYLAEHDPLRTGKVSALEIVRADGDGGKSVWSYAHAGERLPAAEELSQLWGFEVTQRWSRPRLGH